MYNFEKRNGILQNIKFYDENGNYDKVYELSKQLSELDNYQNPQSKSKPKPTNRKGNYTGMNFERRIVKGVIMKNEYLKLFKGPTTVYEFLWANIVRGEMFNDKLNIKQNYYDKGFLACSFTYRELGRRLFLSHHTVQKYINEMKDSGILKVDHIKTGEVKINQKTGTKFQSEQVVFILGTWKSIDENKIEIFYFDEVFGK